MPNEEHHHLEKENSQYQNQNCSIYDNMPAANGMMHRRSLVFMSTSKYLMRCEHAGIKLYVLEVKGLRIDYKKQANVLLIEPVLIRTFRTLQKSSRLS